MKDKKIKTQKKNPKTQKMSKNQKTQKNQKKKMKLWKKILIIILLIILAGLSWFIYKTEKNGGGLSGMLATVVGHDENTKKNLPEIKVLVLGVSNGIEAKLTDTIMVASYNPKEQKASLLSIPRDTFTGTNVKRATANNKINAIYSISEDPQKVLKEVNRITGLDIRYYLVVETNALRKLVDSIGGVKFDVPIDMDYDDTSQDLAIHIKKGEQLLNGEQAEGVVRFRKNNNGTSYPVEYGDNDIGRMRTQREFIITVIKQTAKIGNIFKIGEWIDILEKNVKSNLDFKVVKDYVPYAVEFNTDNMKTSTLPGTTPDLRTTNNVSIFVTDQKETKKVIEELFYDGNKEDETSSNSATSKNSNITVELLNGTGDSKILTSVEEKLKKLGYNVTKKGPTNETKKTTIINKKDVKQEELEKLQNNLGVGDIQNSKLSTAKADVTIVIGTDYK